MTDTLPMSAINIKRIGEYLSVSSRGRLLHELRGRVPAVLKAPKQQLGF